MTSHVSMALGCTMSLLGGRDRPDICDIDLGPANYPIDTTTHFLASTPKRKSQRDTFSRRRPRPIDNMF